jgi:hypothetical protein
MFDLKVSKYPLIPPEVLTGGSVLSEEVDSNSTVLISGNAAHWPTNYRGDYRDQPARTICTHDLICWAYQIARGMAYLAKKKVMTDGYHLSYIIYLIGHWPLFFGSKPS